MGWVLMVVFGVTGSIAGHCVETRVLSQDIVSFFGGMMGSLIGAVLGSAMEIVRAIDRRNKEQL